MNSIICQIPILGKFKKIKGPCTTNQSIASLIMHILDHIKQAKFGSTRTIFECYHIPGPWKNKHPLHLKTCNIVLCVITSCLTRPINPKYHSRPCYYINYTDFKKCLDIFDNQTTLHMVAMCDNSRILYNNLIYKSSIHIHTTS